MEKAKNLFSNSLTIEEEKKMYQTLSLVFDTLGH